MSDTSMADKDFLLCNCRVNKVKDDEQNNPLSIEPAR